MEPMSRIEALRQIVETHSAALIDNFWVDANTAQMLVLVHDHLGPEAQAKFERIPLTRLVDFGWAHVKSPGAA